MPGGETSPFEQVGVDPQVGHRLGWRLAPARHYAVI
jgi:hypothetical protein